MHPITQTLFSVGNVEGALGQHREGDNALVDRPRVKAILAQIVGHQVHPLPSERDEAVRTLSDVAPMPAPFEGQQSVPSAQGSPDVLSGLL